MSVSGKRSESNFWSGGLTIFGSRLVVKLLGLIYRLVITNIDGFGDVGNGYYNAGFQIYTLLMGMLSKSDSILNLLLALNTAFMTILVPSVTGLLASNTLALLTVIASSVILYFSLHFISDKKFKFRATRY